MHKPLAIVAFLNLLLFCSCAQKSSHCDIGYETIHSFALETAKKNPWYVSSYGGSFYDNAVHGLYIGFSVYDKKVQIDEARHLLVEATEEFLKSINENEKIHPFLDHFPFTSKGIHFHLSFLDSKGGFISDNNHVASIFLMEGTINYSLAEGYRLKSIRYETYEEALRIEGKQNHSSQPLTLNLEKTKF